MLWIYCREFGQEWDEGVPSLLLLWQKWLKSQSFSPAEVVQIVQHNASENPEGELAGRVTWLEDMADTLTLMLIMQQCKHLMIFVQGDGFWNENGSNSLQTSCLLPLSYLGVCPGSGQGHFCYYQWSMWAEVFSLGTGEFLQQLSFTPYISRYRECLFSFILHPLSQGLSNTFI